jgi:hypothetical protein
MITVCAWCQRMLGADAEDRLLISHGMCGPCQTASRRAGTGAPTPTLVVPVQYADLAPSLEKLLRETGIPVVVDRRMGQRRRASDGGPSEDRRRGADRRANTAPQLT